MPNTLAAPKPPRTKRKAKEDDYHFITEVGPNRIVADTDDPEMAELVAERLELLARGMKAALAANLSAIERRAGELAGVKAAAAGTGTEERKAA